MAIAYIRLEAIAVRLEAARKRMTMPAEKNGKRTSVEACLKALQCSSRFNACLPVICIASFIPSMFTQLG